MRWEVRGESVNPLMCLIFPLRVLRRCLSGLGLDPKTPAAAGAQKFTVVSVCGRVREATHLGEGGGLGGLGLGDLRGRPKMLAMLAYTFDQPIQAWYDDLQFVGC